MKKSTDILYVLRIGGILLLICGIISGLLAYVNGITASAIAENDEAARLAAISGIFGDGITVENCDIPFASPVTAASEVKQGGVLTGYAVSVTGSGFGGKIEMIVGVSAGGECVGVRILSMSETPGVGSKTGSTDFLSRFEGKSGAIEIKKDIDAVAGATISSKAVTAAVSAVLQQFNGEAN